MNKRIDTTLSIKAIFQGFLNNGEISIVNPVIKNITAPILAKSLHTIANPCSFIEENARFKIQENTVRNILNISILCNLFII